MGFYPAPPRIGETGYKGTQKSNRLYLKNCYTFECKKGLPISQSAAPYTNI
jgi:hypothetical protein